MHEPAGQASGPKVYFFGARNESFIKIGYTTQGLTKRRDGIEVGDCKLMDTGGGLLLLAAVHGVRADEQALHRYFKTCSMTDEFPNANEYYYPKPELVDYIRWLRNQYFVARSEESPLPFRVTSEHWLPREGRFMRPPPPSTYVDADPWTSVFPEPELTGDDYYTDKRIINAAREVLGEIDLDPASHPVANEIVRAACIFTNADNGLVRPWHGKVWLNPPFSQWGEWAAKIRDEWVGGAIEEMCVLAATRTLTAKQFKPVFDCAAAMCILHGRIPFWGPKATGSPDDGHAIFYFGTEVDKFREVFKGLGAVAYFPSKAARKPNGVLLARA